MKAIAGALGALKSGDGLKGQLMRGGVGSIAVKMASTLLAVILSVVLARALGAEGFGVYSFVFALITIMAIPAQMGLPNLVVRETAKAQVAGDWALIKGLWRWATIMGLIMSLVLMALGATTALIFAQSLPDGGLGVFYWGLVLVPLVALGNLRGAALRGMRHVVQGQLPEFILRPVFLIILVLGMHFVPSVQSFQASDAMMLHAAASLLAFIIGAYMLLRIRPHELTSEPDVKTRAWSWVKSALPLGMIGGMQLVNQHIGLIVLGVVGTAQDVGLFRIAVQAAALVVFGQQAVNMVVAPHFARLHANGETARLQRLATMGARLSLLTAAPIALASILFGRDILTLLFGYEFTGAYGAIVLLTLGQIINAFAGSVGFLLNMTGYERDVLFGISVSAVANVILTLIFSSLWGVEGAAIAATLSLIVWNGILIASVWRRLKFDSTAIGYMTS